MNAFPLFWSIVLAWAPIEPVDFLFDVRPILSEHCYACHGPDEKSRKGDLRLDRPAAFQKPLPSGGTLLDPNQPNESELLRRIISTDESEQMPPPAAKNPLTKQQIETIRKWIDQGAKLPEKSHWAFNSVNAIPLPTSAASAEAQNPIDLFIQAKLSRIGLTLNPAANKEVLLRRLSLDLTGVPATIAEIQAFVSDNSSDAYSRQVERLLASPRRGERLATDWLDLARYADTYGYQSDVDRDMSAWRDWVISAFNRNLPYDQFIEWQIAGDLLPNPTREQYLATAFNRLHRQTNEGGSIEEEFRNEYVADRVHTFGTAFLGLTLECSRCHDHKYDPIRQHDYYSLAAFFNNIDESGLYSHFTRATPTPTLFLYPPGDDLEHDRLSAELAQRLKALALVEDRERKRIADSPVPPKVDIARPQPVDAFPFDGETINANTVNATRPAALSDGPVVVPGMSGTALRFSGDNSVQLKGVGVFGRTDPFTMSLAIKPTEKQDRAVILHRSRAWTDSGSRGYELLLDEGRLSFALIHFYPGNAIHIRSREKVAIGEWSQIAVTYDGSSRAEGMALYLNGQRLEVEVIRNNLYRDILHRSDWGDDTGGVELTLAGRFRDSGFRNGEIDQLEVFSRALTELELRRLRVTADDSTDVSSQEAWIAHRLQRSSVEYEQAASAVQVARKAENDLVGRVREIMVMKELSGRRPTYVLRRGAYDQRGEEVQPATPEGILSLDSSLPRNRLGLAKWLTDRRNPLTARVVVNRIWRLHFGKGIVTTQEDFGNQGQLPSHPELLDFLSHWLMDNGWDLAGLQRLIVSSATYQQSSLASAEKLAADPENRWLARGSKRRLSAEQIRDSALRASDLLVGRIGGPSVKPYQPAGLWEEAGTGKSYVQDHGEGLFRRSLYTFWRRTAPPPTMLTFDATSREVCTAKRETTATPLQSLVLMNDPQYVEAARVLAEHLQGELHLSPDARLEMAMLTVVGRSPRESEWATLRRMYAEQREWFQAHPQEAAAYLAVGEASHPANLPPVETAALAVFVNSLFNMDEFVIER